MSPDIEKIAEGIELFEIFRYRYLQNVIHLLPESYRANQLKAGGFLAQLVIESETKFLQKPFQLAIKEALRLYEKERNVRFEPIK